MRRNQRRVTAVTNGRSRNPRRSARLCLGWAGFVGKVDRRGADKMLRLVTPVDRRPEARATGRVAPATARETPDAAVRVCCTAMGASTTASEARVPAGEGCRTGWDACRTVWRHVGAARRRPGWNFRALTTSGRTFRPSAESFAIVEMVALGAGRIPAPVQFMCSSAPTGSGSPRDGSRPACQATSAGPKRSPSAPSDILPGRSTAHPDS